MKDLFKILEVSEDADQAAIKKAYRKLAKENHPDATGGDKKKTERFKEINEAYDVLSDKEKRAAYTRLKNAPVRSDGMPEGFDPEIFARTFGGGVGGGGVRMGRGAAGFGDAAGGV
ncbi:MAG: DnaJ domain-containing protein, partial [Myxococcales bacterium]